MGYRTHMENLIESKLLQVNTCFIGKVLSVSSDLKKAKIQALGKMKNKDGTTKSRGVLQDVPVANSARYKFSELVPERFEKLEAGDLVICVCADRDITQAKKGKDAVPNMGHHELNDALVIGIL